MGVQTGRLRPQWPPGSPVGLVDISQRCWVQDPDARPSFVEIIEELNKVESDLRMELLAVPEPSAPPSATVDGSTDASSTPSR